MMKKFELIKILLLFTAITHFIFFGVAGIKNKASDSGIPHIVNCFSTNADYNLTVVANCDFIPDKEEFARTVITMCRENSFKTIKFSNDVIGYPTSLNITVYPYKEDIRTNDPVCIIRFDTTDHNKEYDIKNNPEYFQLYLDGKKIEYY